MNARTFTNYVRIRPLLLQKTHCHLRPFLGVFGLAVTHHYGEETLFALWQWSQLDKTDEHAYYHRALQWLILKYQDKCKLESVWATKLETSFDKQIKKKRMTSVSPIGSMVYFYTCTIKSTLHVDKLQVSPMGRTYPLPIMILTNLFLKILHMPCAESGFLSWICQGGRVVELLGWHRNLVGTWLVNGW